MGRRQTFFLENNRVSVKWGQLQVQTGKLLTFAITAMNRPVRRTINGRSRLERTELVFKPLFGYTGDASG